MDKKVFNRDLKKSLHADWLEEVSSSNRKADKILIEKVIRALLLLEGVSKSGLDFVFKGGTALMLLTGSTKRLSIDIDIMVSGQSGLEDLFQFFLEEQGFSRFEPQERSAATKIKKAHFKFFIIRYTGTVWPKTMCYWIYFSKNRCDMQRSMLAKTKN